MVSLEVWVGGEEVFVRRRGEGSDRANSLVWLQAQGTTDSRSRDCASQVIGNVWSIIIEGFLAFLWATKEINGVASKSADSQLQQRQVCVAVIGPVLALLRDVVLEDAGGFRVVAIEAVEDGIDVLRPFWRIVEGNAHCCRESAVVYQVEDRQFQIEESSAVCGRTARWPRKQTRAATIPTMNAE